MRIEIQLKYNTGFETIEVCDHENAAIRQANAYRRRGYTVRIVHEGEVCHVNARSQTLGKTRRVGNVTERRLFSVPSSL